MEMKVISDEYQEDEYEDSDMDVKRRWVKGYELA